MDASRMARLGQASQRCQASLHSLVRQTSIALQGRPPYYWCRALRTAAPQGGARRHAASAPLPHFRSPLALPPGRGRCHRCSRESFSAPACPSRPARTWPRPRSSALPAVQPSAVRPGSAMASDSDTEEFYDAPEDVHLAATSPAP